MLLSASPVRAENLLWSEVQGFYRITLGSVFETLNSVMRSAGRVDVAHSSHDAVLRGVARCLNGYL